MQPDAQRLIDNVETLKIYFDPLRMRLLSAMAGEPRTVADLAEELGVPFTRLYYHMHLLEQHGLIRLVETRSISGAVEEKLYQVSAREFLVDRRLLRPGTPEGDDVFNATIQGTLRSTEDNLRLAMYNGQIDADAYPPDPLALLLRRGAFRLTAEHARQISEKLIAVTRDMHAFEEQDTAAEDARDYMFLIAYYPTLLNFDQED